jgi:hypothetical protein
VAVFLCQPTRAPAISALSLSGEVVMEIKLTPSFLLSDEHGKSSLKMPVLVNLRTKEPSNPSEFMEAYPPSGENAGS